jgi:hypothetical protein
MEYTTSSKAGPRSDSGESGDVEALDFGSNAARQEGVDGVDFSGDTSAKSAKIFKKHFAGQPAGAMAARLAALSAAGASARNTRKVAAIALSEQATLLGELVKLGTGSTLLDEMVASVGEKAKRKDTKNFVAESIKARYGIASLSGDLTTAMLPRLYKVLKTVPDAHTASNDKLADMVRDRKSEEAPYYREKDRLVALNTPKTGESHEIENAEGSTTKLNYFDHTTLHEVGHAVDAKLKFMDRNQAKAGFGSWIEHGNPDQTMVNALVKEYRRDPAYATENEEGAYAVIDKLLEGGTLDKAVDEAKASMSQMQTSNKSMVERGKGMDWAEVASAKELSDAEGWLKSHQDASDSEIDKKFREIYAGVKGKSAYGVRMVIERMMLRRNTQDEAIALVKQRYQGNEDLGEVDWDSLKQMKLADKIAAMKLKGQADGLWEKGDGEVLDAAVDGRVFHESYKGKWVSYDADARKNRVSRYQFRASGEWFAEIYALYYLGKLPDSHPAQTWMKAEIDDKGQTPDEV